MISYCEGHDYDPGCVDSILVALEQVNISEKPAAPSVYYEDRSAFEIG